MYVVKRDGSKAEVRMDKIINRVKALCGDLCPDYIDPLKVSTKVVQVKQHPPLKNCASCGKPNARERCSGCRSAHYCNEACQKSHWGAHKGPCRATRAAPPAPPPPARGSLCAGSPLRPLR